MAEKKKDRRTLKTQKALRDALAELLAEKKLEKITVQEIADKADVNRVTFYKHFLDVYDLYEKIEQETLVQLGMLVLQLEDLPAEELFPHMIGYIAENQMIFRMIFSPNNTGTLQNKLSKMLEGLFLKLESEKRGTALDNKELGYLCSYRAQGCLAVIARWVMGGYVDPQDLIGKTLSALDASTERLFEELSGSK
ncbi:MAG: TetR/AcrR family transcriptional regulator C-terminal domain-containing protein [Oscillospiraceae bacterium]|nr:TetR/AcrR family transcriptional regulator C-terminal domain-containing protein [Oscillospiraceae bacterium]